MAPHMHTSSVSMLPGVSLRAHSPSLQRSVRLLFITILCLLSLLRIVHVLAFSSNAGSAHLLDGHDPSSPRAWGSQRSREHFYIFGDAGSTGTRLRVFRAYVTHEASASASSGGNYGLSRAWELTELAAIKDAPALSKLALQAQNTNDRSFDAAWSSFEPYVLRAVRHLPLDALTSRTYVRIYATAGMRQLFAPAFADAMYASFERKVKSLYPQLRSGRDRVIIRTITGDQEGLYAWVAANYAARGFDAVAAAARGDVRASAIALGALDLGGGSAQVAALRTGSADEGLAQEEDAGADSAIDGSTLTAALASRVYVKSYGGIGAKHLAEALRRRVAHAAAAAGRVTNGATPTPDSADAAAESPMFSDVTGERVGTVLRQWENDGVLRTRCTTILDPDGDADAAAAAAMAPPACAADPCRFRGFAADATEAGDETAQGASLSPSSPLPRVIGTGDFPRCRSIVAAALADAVGTGGNPLASMVLPHGVPSETTFAAAGLFHHFAAFARGVAALAHAAASTEDAAALAALSPALHGKELRPEDVPELSSANPGPGELARFGRFLCGSFAGPAALAALHAGDPLTSESRASGRCFDAALIVALLAGDARHIRRGQDHEGDARFVGWNVSSVAYANVEWSVGALVIELLDGGGSADVFPRRHRKDIVSGSMSSSSPSSSSITIRPPTTFMVVAFVLPSLAGLAWFLVCRDSSRTASTRPKAKV